MFAEPHPDKRGSRVAHEHIAYRCIDDQTFAEQPKSDDGSSQHPKDAGKLPNLILPMDAPEKLHELLIEIRERKPRDFEEAFERKNWNEDFEREISAEPAVGKSIKQGEKVKRFSFNFFKNV